MRLAFWAHLYKVPWNMPPNFDLVRIYCTRNIYTIYNGDNNEVFLKVKRQIYS